nr:uncharacterized protein LOC113822482 [Penaeus vannamei]
MTDFEKAAMKAFQRNFPSAEVAGCYFHLGQSVWRHIQNLGLAARYREDAAFATRVRRFLALAFDPLADVHHYTRILLADEISKDDGLLDLAKYFQETYVGQLIHGDMEIPGKFPYQTWNMYQRVKDDLPRTNNALEGWHNGFARMLPDHPQLPLLAAKYQKEQHKSALNHEHHAAGRKHPSSQKKYQLVNKRIKSLITKLETYTLVDLQYLDQIAKVMVIPILRVLIAPHSLFHATVYTAFEHPGDCYRVQLNRRQSTQSERVELRQGIIYQIYRSKGLFGVLRSFTPTAIRRAALTPASEESDSAAGLEPPEATGGRRFEAPGDERTVVSLHRLPAFIFAEF